MKTIILYIFFAGGVFTGYSQSVNTNLVTEDNSKARVITFNSPEPVFITANLNRDTKRTIIDGPEIILHKDINEGSIGNTTDENSTRIFFNGPEIKVISTKNIDSKNK